MSTGILLVVTAAAVLACFVQGAALRRYRLRHDALCQDFQRSLKRVQQIEQEMGALCNASVGAGDHVVRLEQQVQRIIERQNGLEMRAAGERPYNQASQLVHKGANIDELVDTCGLTRGEAELLVMMQRGAA